MKYLLDIVNNKDKAQVSEIEKYCNIIYISDILQNIIGIEILENDNTNIKNIKKLNFVNKIQEDRKGHLC